MIARLSAASLSGSVSACTRCTQFAGRDRQDPHPPGRRVSELSGTSATGATPRAGGWCGRCRNRWRATYFGPALATPPSLGADQLRKNLAQVIGTTPGRVPRSLMRASLASYARYWREAFRLPSMDSPDWPIGSIRCSSAPNTLRRRIRPPWRGDGAAAQWQLGHGRRVAGAELTAPSPRWPNGSSRNVALRPLHRIPGRASASGCCRPPVGTARRWRCSQSGCAPTGSSA